MGERAAYYPTSEQEPVYDQALSAIDQINDPQISKNWARTGFEVGAIRLPDLLSPPTLARMNREHKVSWHEIGHAAMARVCGWLVNKISIIPDGNTLGITITSPGRSKNPKTVLEEAIQIKLAGEAAEEIAGIEDHSGAGHDKGSARYLARIVSLMTGESSDQILSRSKSAVRRTLGGIGAAVLEMQSWNLFQRKVVT